MRHKPIRNIKTRIRNKRQLVIVEFDNKEFVFITPNNIKQNTSLEVFELELLIGSTMRIEFYKKGEKMFNGKECNKDNLIVKEYFFELQKPVDKLRVENATQLLGYKRIKEIFYFHKFGKDNVGIKAQDDKVTFLSLKRFEIQSKLDKSEQHILVGSYILPEYYKTGETLPNGTIVTQDNKILRWINLRYSDNVEGMHENFENAIGYYDGEDYYDGYDDGPGAYGYSSWDEMALYEAFEGDPSNYWNVD
ncbi:MAG: hypothetical protein JST38_01925 [Bacteroidetes bacterium]|nr:hypothetical protein [Bacteroidota bacterium]